MLRDGLRNENALCAPEVAQILQIGRNTVYELAKSGKLGSYKVGRKLRFTMADVQAYIDSSRRHAAGDSEGASAAAAPHETAATLAATSATSAATATPKAHAGTSAGNAQGKARKALAPASEAALDGALEALGALGAGKGPAFVMAGHDMLIDMLANYVAGAGIAAQRAYMNSYEGLVSLYAGSAHAAGVHLWDGESGQYNLPYVKRLLPGVPCVVIHLARRTQGLLVRKGNPKGIRRWADLLRPGIMLANREKGAGARVLLDEHLRMLEAPYACVEGYERTLKSELAVGTFVAQGLADVGIGGERTFRHVPGLGYLPLAEERLDLVVVKTPQTKRAIQLIKGTLKSVGFRAEFENSIGIDIGKMGAVAYEC